MIFGFSLFLTCETILVPDLFTVPEKKDYFCEMELLKVESIFIEFKINPAIRGNEFTLLQPEFLFSPSSGLSKVDFSTATIGMKLISQYGNQQKVVGVSFITETKAIVDIKDGKGELEVCKEIAKIAIAAHNNELLFQTNKNKVKLNSEIILGEKEETRLANVLLKHFMDSF